MEERADLARLDAKGITTMIGVHRNPVKHIPIMAGCQPEKAMWSRLKQKANSYIITAHADRHVSKTSFMVCSLS